MPERPDSEREVLTSLPRTRPVRRSAKRGDRPAIDNAARAAAKPVAARKPRAAKPAGGGAPAKPAAAPRARTRPGTTATSMPKPAAARTARAGRVGTPAPPAAGAERPRVAPQRKVPAAGYATPDARDTEPNASAGAELVSTAIQAAAELAQIGLTVGRQTLRSMLDRLPKP